MSKYDDPDVAYDREIEVEALVMRLADVIQETIEAQGLTRAELARLMGVSKPHITQTLSGQRNLTLKTAAEALHALDSRLEVSAVPLAAAASGAFSTGSRTHGTGANLRNVIDLAKARALRSFDQSWQQRSQDGSVSEAMASGVPVLEALVVSQALAAAHG